jgi:pseudouridine synthase
VIHAARAVVIALHKPRGVVCTASAQDRRPIITELMPKSFGRLFTVGRLDAESEGLILLTNQGDLAQRLAHPKHKVEKEYRVKLDRAPDEAVLRQMEKGVRLKEGLAKEGFSQWQAGSPDDFKTRHETTDPIDVPDPGFYRGEVEANPYRRTGARASGPGSLARAFLS